jgi:Na+-driven multidrug efflux pump
MKSESVIIFSGLIMVFSGFLLFYFIENSSNLDNVVKYTKHAGIYVGLLGIGVTIAGILLQIMGREQPPIQEDVDI